MILDQITSARTAKIKMPENATPIKYYLKNQVTKFGVKTSWKPYSKSKKQSEAT